MARVKIEKAPAPRMSAEEKRWRAESDLRTLRDADQIKNDRGRLSAAKAEAKRQLDSLSRVAKGGARPKARTTAKPASRRK